MSYLTIFFLFFFSSRRRHTRYWRDWSSDVCSSDLAGGERLAVGQGVGLFREGALRPIDHPVGAEVGAVEVVGAAGQGLALEPLDPLVGDAVVVRVGELPDAWGGGDVEGAGVPHRALGEHHLVGEDRLLVEDAVIVGVLEADDAVGLFGELLLGAG